MVLIFFEYRLTGSLCRVKILIFLKYCCKIFMYILIQKRLRRPLLPTPGATKPLPLPRVEAGFSAEAGDSSAMPWSLSITLLN
jgi:hypothetical protein